jgi:surface protein
VSDWNVGNVTNMEFTFGGCEQFVTLDASNWDVSKVTSFDAFFQSSRKTKGAMKLEYLDVSKWDTSSCVNYDRMFFWCSELKMLDMSSWNSENVKDTGSMFFNCGSLTTLYASERWSTASLTYSEGMFTGCSQLVGGNGTAFATARVTDGSYAQIDTPETPGYLTYKAAPN